MDIINLPVYQQYITIWDAVEFPVMPLLSLLFSSCNTYADSSKLIGD